MKNTIKIILKMNILSVIFLLGIYFLINIEVNDTIMTEHHEKIRAVTDVIYSLALDFEDQYRKNTTLRREVLQEEFINIVNKVRYDKNEYFFIIDGRGNIIIDPLNPDLSWWNLLYEEDSEGNFLFRELLNDAKRNNEVILETNWKSKYNDQLFENQVIYGKYLWQWDWLICTTIYSDEIMHREGTPNVKILVYLLLFNIFFNLTVFSLILKQTT